MKKESKEELRQSLDDLLGYDLPDEIPGIDMGAELPRVSASSQVSPVEDKSRVKAQKVMDKLLRFYLSEEVIEEQEYIKAKAELDKQALGSLIKQMENSDRAINILMDTIFEGDVAPRMFEVLSDLQRTMLDIIKSQTMYMIAIEENARKMAREIDIYQPQSGMGAHRESSGGSVKSRGTKDLMRALQNTIKEEAKDVLEINGVDAVAAANIFQHIDQSVFLAHKFLYTQGVNVRKPQLLR